MFNEQHKKESLFLGMDFGMGGGIASIPIWGKLVFSGSASGGTEITVKQL